MVVVLKDLFQLEVRTSNQPRAGVAQSVARVVLCFRDAQEVDGTESVALSGSQNIKASHLLLPSLWRASSANLCLVVARLLAFQSAHPSRDLAPALSSINLSDALLLIYRALNAGCQFLQVPSADQGGGPDPLCAGSAGRQPNQSFVPLFLCLERLLLCLFLHSGLFCAVSWRPATHSDVAASSTTAVSVFGCRCLCTPPNVVPPPQSLTSLWLLC